MNTQVTNFNIEDIYASEEKKSTFDYLQKMVDYSIARLVYEKKRIKKCRNLYEGVRDKEEFKYLEETYGIETPIGIKMTPLVKTRIDVLLGILLDEVFTYHISINDESTLTTVENTKLKLKADTILNKYKEHFKAAGDNINKGLEPGPSPIDKPYLDSVEKLINENFISEFEIAAQSLINFFEQDLTIDLQQKVKQYFLDLLTTGEAYYRTYVSQVGSDPIFEICKPENIFFNKNTNHQFISSGHQPNINIVVHREYMKREEILNKWGHLMNETDKENMFGNAPSQSGHTNIIKSAREIEYNNRYRDGMVGAHEQYTYDGTNFLPVYHVEWLANNEVELSEEEKTDMQVVENITSKKDFDEFYGKNAGTGVPRKIGYRLDKYEGIRIGDQIYLNCGKSKYTTRSESTPWRTTLSYNGIGYNERNGTAYSIAWSLKDLQDSFDIIMFYRDNLIANSGVNGSRINLAAIPKVLGQNFMERLLKFMALRKQGIEIYDPTEDGASLFSGYGDFNGSLDGNVLASLNAVLETIQAQADIISGVNRHMYAAAEVRDAVSNVKIGQQTTSLVTKDLFELVNTSRRHMLTDLINQAKYTYKKGKRGSYIVGHRSILFDIQPQQFCFTDYNIHVISSSKENLKIEKLNAIVPELIKQGALDPGIIVKMTLSNSTTEIVKMINENLIVKKEENDAIKQLQQQLQELSGQTKEMQKSLETANKQLEAAKAQSIVLREREVKVKEKDLEARIKLDDRKFILEDYKFKEETKKDQSIIQLEREQLYAENTKGNAREIKNNF